MVHIIIFFIKKIQFQVHEDEFDAGSDKLSCFRLQSSGEYIIACGYLQKIGQTPKINSFYPVKSGKHCRMQNKLKKEKKVKINDKYEIYIRNLFAANLKKLRSDRHMSQMDLADVTNLSSNFINEIENKKKWPSIETLAKLVKALSIEPYKLFVPETMLKVDKADLLKVEISDSITLMISEKLDRYITENSEIP